MIAVGAGIFFAALMSLYHMLEVIQRVELEFGREGPAGQMEEV